MKLQTLSFVKPFKPNRWLGSLSQMLLLIAVALLAGCTINPALPVRGDEPLFVSTRPYPIPLPGNYPSYAWGTAQLKENFENVEIAQWATGTFQKSRTWVNISPSSIHSAQIIGLGSYIPFSVRWRLKDGREFIVENIDTASIMQEYFKTNSLKLPWQEEGRQPDVRSDPDPLLAHEVKNEFLILKWLIRKNENPLDQRFLPNGGAIRWKMSSKEYTVTTLAGIPTSGIDFNKRMEFR